MKIKELIAEICRSPILNKKFISGKAELLQFIKDSDLNSKIVKVEEY